MGLLFSGNRITKTDSTIITTLEDFSQEINWDGHSSFTIDIYANDKETVFTRINVNSDFNSTNFIYSTTFDNYPLELNFSFSNNKLTIVGATYQGWDVIVYFGPGKYITGIGEDFGAVIDFSHTKIWLESKPEQKNMVINGNTNLFSVHNENYILLKGNCIFEEL